MFNIFKRGNSQPKQCTSKYTRIISFCFLIEIPVQSPRVQEVQKVNPVQLQSPKSQQFVYTNDIKLRQNFADELLELELEIESPNVTIETITALLSLYREAVEYFEAIQSNKYLVFKNKIQNLLTKKNVQSAMNYQVPEKLKSTAIAQTKEKNEQLQEEQKQKELKIRLDYIRQQDQQSSVNNLLNEHSEKQEKMNQIISEDIQEQKDAFQKRIQQRRNSSVKKDGQTFVVNQESPQKSAQNLSALEPTFNTSHAPVIRSANKTYQPYQPRGRTGQLEDLQES